MMNRDQVNTNNAHPLRPRLAGLLRGIESQDEPEAVALAQALLQDLDESTPVATGPGPVRFSALYHAVAREVRSGERAIVAGNWMGAAKSVRVAISILPE